MTKEKTHKYPMYFVPEWENGKLLYAVLLPAFAAVAYGNDLEEARGTAEDFIKAMVEAAIENKKPLPNAAFVNENYEEWLKKDCMRVNVTVCL
ncbi:MAG TPA: hypothetical protein VK308_00160 [Pyrinomonadaceae bacterium]|nr:hypothetical protein [Pyrinomonadaceae bacterium]